MIKERTSNTIYSNILVYVDRPVPYPVDRPYPVQHEKIVPGKDIKFDFWQRTCLIITYCFVI